MNTPENPNPTGGTEASKPVTPPIDPPRSGEEIVCCIGLFESLAKIAERSAVSCRVSSGSNPDYSIAFWTAGIVLDGITAELRAEIEKLSNSKFNERESA
jgi:hypothetical protein